MMSIKLIASVAATTVALASTCAFAQNDDLSSRVSALESQINSMSGGVVTLNSALSYDLLNGASSIDQSANVKNAKMDANTLSLGGYVALGYQKATYKDGSTDTDTSEDLGFDAASLGMVARVGNLGLTVIAAFAFFAATIGINMVANFVPPAYDLANLIPSKIDFRTGGLITSIVGFIIGALWVSFISQVGMFPFVNTLGAILAPVFGIMIVDYYVIKNEKLDVNALYNDKPKGKYYYNGGFNHKGMLAWVISGYIAVDSVWPNILPGGLGDFFANLGGGGGYAWMIGAALGAVIHLAISNRGK